MDNFEKSWQMIKTNRNGVSISTELRQLIENVYQKMLKQPPDFLEIKLSLEELFIYLTTSAGRTSANCYATDLFFAITDWEVDWEIFPESLTDIIGNIGGALHDTVEYPDIAENFNGLPEQILESIHNWNPSRLSRK